MLWSKRTEKIWQAFEQAVLNRDKSQFELFVEFRKSQRLDEKRQQSLQLNEDELTF